MNTSRKGNQKELRSGEILEEEGWTVGSRRHIAGPGDWLACKEGERSRLIEVKASKRPYENFRRPDRAELRQHAVDRGLVAELAWWPPRARSHTLIDEAEWPD